MGLSGKINKVTKKIGYAIFLLNGRKPWSSGYSTYKEEHIKKALSIGNFDPKRLATGYGFRIDERIIEYPWLFSSLPSGEGNLLDAGSILNFDFIVSHKSLEGKRVFISTLAPESNCFWSNGVNYIYEDLRDACYKDNFFDWVVSLSTIEHIGLDNSMLYAADAKKENNPASYLDAIMEFRRVLKPGGRLYLSMPFGKYKNHGWFQVFDGKMVDGLIKAFSPASISENYFKYESDGWHPSTREKAKDSTCFDIHFQKEYDPDFAAFSRAIICLEMVK